MMQDGDLARFAELVRKANGQITVARNDLPTILGDPNGALLATEVWRLSKSAECALHAGELSPEIGEVAQAIDKQLSEERIVGFDNEAAWLEAIASVQPVPPKYYTLPDPTRAQVVGEACARLKARGRKLTIGAYGPNWNDSSLREACSEVDALITRFGGSEAINRMGAILKDGDRVFEGVWLFGERGLGIKQRKEPAVPYGWLLGLAAKHAHRPPRCRNPNKAWRTLVEQSWDIAASFDCQRYGQYEGMTVPPSEIDRSMQDSVRWRSLFYTAQTPRLVLPIMRKAFEAELASGAPTAFAASVRSLWSEITRLIRHLTDDRCCIIRRQDAARDFPTLARVSHGPAGKVNRSYLIPIGHPARNDTRFVFLDGPGADYIIRPISITVQAFCETIFGFVWRELPRARAEEFVGNVIERCLASACKGKADTVLPNLGYSADGKDLEIDVATRSGDAITLIEAKAKSLTANGQVGLSGAFYADYARSYLPMLEQLARHEGHVKGGYTSLIKASEVTDDLQIEKIAVSPVSYGPIGDRMGTTAVQSALFHASLHALDEADTDAAKAIKAFNKALRKAQDEIVKAAPLDHEGKLDLFVFFLFTHWLDLGQLLFALDRVNRIDQALRPIRHMTTGSRDFWSEMANATSMGLGSSA